MECLNGERGSFGFDWRRSHQRGPQNETNSKAMSQSKLGCSSRLPANENNDPRGPDGSPIHASRYAVEAAWQEDGHALSRQTGPRVAVSRRRRTSGAWFSVCELLRMLPLAGRSSARPALDERASDRYARSGDSSMGPVLRRG
jgi:hypothetical protein